MKKLTKKGFTLVELMAVIVVLAIIVVLAFNKIKNSLKKSNQDTVVANGIVFVKAVNDQAAQSRVTNLFPDGEYSVASLFEEGLSLTGTKPDSGNIVIENGEVVSGCLLYKGDYVLITNGNVKYVKSCETSNVYAFEYKGEEEVLTIDGKGTYRIEIWGAQGGDGNTVKGGYGGYSTGTVFLNAGDKLYINVGEQGGSYYQQVGAKSYNGGGAAGRNGNYVSHIGSGGGATSIAFSTGLLKNLSSNRESILMVAGGGGGADFWQSGSSIDAEGGGAGGGFTGVTGQNISHTPGTGGTQSAGGTGNSSGSFGQGADGPTGAPGGAGGGGGFFGGGSSYDNAGAGGGSGYIGNSRLQNKAMYCYKCATSPAQDTLTISTNCASEAPTTNCSKIGYGYVRITSVGKNSDPFNLKFNGYKKLDYVESNGTQSILTYITPSNTTGVKATVSSSNVSSDLVYFGCKTSDTRYWVGNYSNKLYFGINGNSNNQTGISANAKYVVKFNYNNDRQLLVGDTVVNPSMPTIGTITHPMAIFAGNSAGTISYKSSIKLYDLSITENSTEISHMIPCERTSDEVVGLCDVITGNFLTSDASTPLTKGSYVN